MNKLKISIMHPKLYRYIHIIRKLTNLLPVGTDPSLSNESDFGVAGYGLGFTIFTN